MSEIPFDVRLVEGDDFDQYFDVRAQAFGVPGDQRDGWLDRVRAMPDIVSFGAFRSGRLLGALRVIPAGQFVNGRSVPMGGVAAVVVRPEVRGSGVARTLLTHAIEWMQTTGIAVSSLHPASTRAYRSAGWELVGRAGWLLVPSRSFASMRGDAAGPVERLDPRGGPEVHACYARWAPDVSGAVDRSAAFWSLHEHGGGEDGAFLYGVRTDGELTGYVAYTQTPDARSWGYGLRVDDVCALDKASAIALWRFIGSHSMQVERVQVPVSALPALSFLLDEQDAVTDLENHWMHRIVDVPAAMAARGYPEGTTGTVDVVITDPLAPGTVGAWTMAVADGRGTAEPTAATERAVRLDIGALSALSIGGTTARVLRNVGRLTGPDDAAARLDAILAAPAPTITDDF